jgi:hypothetical protein
VTIKPVAESAFPVQLTPAQREFFEFTRAFTIDFGGATPAKDLGLSITPSGAETPQDRWVVGMIQQFEGRTIMTPADMARVVGDRVITTMSGPCRGVEAAGMYGFIRSLQPLRMVYGRFVTEGGVAPGLVEASQPKSDGAASIPLPYGLIESTPEAVIDECVPVASGLATVAVNGAHLLVAASQLRLTDAEIVVVNQTSGNLRRYPRNVAQYRFVVRGSELDRFEVAAVGVNSERVVPFHVDATGRQMVTIRVDMDRFGGADAEIVVRNRSREPFEVTRFAAADARVEIPATGKSSDQYEVSALNSSAEIRTLQFVVRAPEVPGNLIARVLPGSIEAGSDVFLIDSSDDVLDAQDPRTPIPPSVIVDGGFAFGFDGVSTHLFGLDIRPPTVAPAEEMGGPSAMSDSTDTVFLMDVQAQPHMVTVPRVVLTIVGGVTGQPRKVEIQVPPLDETASPIGASSHDKTPPKIVEQPTLLGSFNPAVPLSFIFSEPIDRANSTLKVRLSRDGVAVAGQLRFSNGNRIVTFVPASPLVLGVAYELALEGVRDGAGNLMANRVIAITTSEPLTLGPTFTHPQLGVVKDILLVRDESSVSSHMFAVSTLAQEAVQVGNHVGSISVADPRNPTLSVSVAGDAIPVRGAVLRGLRHISLNRDSPCGREDTSASQFKGDLLFVVGNFRKSTPERVTDTNSLQIYDVTNPFSPCQMGFKFLAQGTEHTFHILGARTRTNPGQAVAVAAVSLPGRAIAYAAVTGMGLLAADLRHNVGTQDIQRIEPMVDGNFLDVASAGTRVVALERPPTGGISVRVFDHNLTSVGLDQKNFEATRLAIVEKLLLDWNNDGEFTADEHRDAVFVGGQTAILVYELTQAGGLIFRDRITVPANVTEFAIDAEQRQVYVAGARAVGDWGILRIDLSGPRPFLRTPTVLDDRIVWQSPLHRYAIPTGWAARGLRFDDVHRLLHVGFDQGIDTYSVAHNLRGKATYTYFPAKLSGGIDYGFAEKNPIRGAIVELRNSNNIVIDRTNTDELGNYAFWAPPNGQVAVVVKAALGTIGHETALVVNNRNQNSLYEYPKTVAPFLMSADKTHDIYAETTWTGQVYGRRDAAPFAILDAIYTAHARLKQVDPLLDFGSALIPMAWSSENLCDGVTRGDVLNWKHYEQNPKLYRIYLCGHEDHDTDEYDRQTILHEWSHYFHDRFSQTKTIGGGHEHKDVLDPRLAFAEGFATAFAAILGETSEHVDTKGPDQAGLVDISNDIELDQYDWGGFFAEDSIEELLWDLYDRNATDKEEELDLEGGGKARDNVDLGIKPFYDAMRAMRRSSAFATIHTFLAYLIESLPQSPNRAALIEDIRRLARAENIEITPDEKRPGKFNQFEQKLSATINRTLERPKRVGIPVGPIYTPIKINTAGLVTHVTQFAPEVIRETTSALDLTTSLVFDGSSVGNRLLGTAYFTLTLEDAKDGKPSQNGSYDIVVEPLHEFARMQVLLVKVDGTVTGTSETELGAPNQEVKVSANLDIGTHSIAVLAWLDKGKSFEAPFKIRVVRK